MPETPSDNTQLNKGAFGDMIRDVLRPNGIKTQVVMLDAGTPAAENLISAGQKTMSDSIPVAIASNYVPVLQQDLIGNAGGYYPTKDPNNVTGRAPVVNNVRVDLWEGPTTTYVFPTAGQQFRIVSTSANDTAAGTGVKSVWFHGLDDTGTEVDFTIALNGLTPVNTIQTNLYRVNSFHAATIGTVDGTAAGDISLTNLAGTVTYAIIKAGNNSSHQAIFTIPAGKTGYLNHWQCSSGAASGSHFTIINIRATQHHGTLNAGVFMTIDEQGTLNGGVTVNFPTPVKFPAMCDVRMSAISDAANASVIAMGPCSDGLSNATSITIKS